MLNQNYRLHALTKQNSRQSKGNLIFHYELERDIEKNKNIFNLENVIE